MKSLAAIAALALLSCVSGASRTLLAADATVEPAADRAPLAWIRFVDGEEIYAGVPYLWLGKVNIDLRIDVAPAPRHVLELLWGSKNDGREAVATINGRDVKIAAGGYDGFRWLSVPVPPGVPGDHYEVTFRQGFANSARTAIMYALWKTQGLTVQPWRADLRFGGRSSRTASSTSA